MSAKNAKANLPEDEHIPAPPDGGYGWVIVFIASLNMFFVLGITYSIGTLLDTLVEVCLESDIGLCK